jgi:uncharacterized UBP type Zn finger protein
MVGMEPITFTPTAAPRCAHAPQTVAAPVGSACEECGSTRSLRACLTCGHVGCCDSQRGDARTHANVSGHAVMQSLPAATGFTWCYEDDAYV